MRFTTHEETGIDAKPIRVYTSGDYTISRNYRVAEGGKFVRWDYEVLFEDFDSNRYPGRVIKIHRLGVSRTLVEAKKIAKDHAEES